ncbi:hypothetical protein O5626_30420 [Escherichia coli]|nr:hypothetical protein [Escherichia coli]
MLRHYAHHRLYSYESADRYNKNPDAAVSDITVDVVSEVQRR